MTHRVRGRRGLLTLSWMLLLATASGCAARQPARTFADLPQRIKPGHTVYVVDDAGREAEGRVVSVSASELTLDVDGARRPMDAGSVRLVERHGDSLWNGLLIGLAVGAPAMLMSDAPRQNTPCQSDPQRSCEDFRVGQRLAAIGVFGAIGAGIDALMRSRSLVYVAPAQSARSDRRIDVSLRLGPSRAGALVRVDLSRKTRPDDGHLRSVTSPAPVAPR